MNAQPDRKIPAAESRAVNLIQESAGLIGDDRNVLPAEAVISARQTESASRPENAAPLYIP
jgi:hypothetical protein